MTGPAADFTQVRPTMGRVNMPPGAPQTGDTAWSGTGADHTRVRAREEFTGWSASAPEAAQRAQPSWLPDVRGRHALRGGAQLLVGRLQFFVVLAVAALALIVGTLWWSGGDGDELAAGEVPQFTSTDRGTDVPAPATDESAGPELDTESGTAAGTGPGTEMGTVVVDVAGRVRRPGIVELEAGSRVADALEAAGGVRGRVDLSSLNLARVLVDGEQVLVGMTPPPGTPATVPGTSVEGGTATTGALVNINTADAAGLDTLPGVGPVTAAAILEWRAEHGIFTSIDELLEVDGIGEATLADLVDKVTL